MVSPPRQGGHLLISPTQRQTRQTDRQIDSQAERASVRENKDSGVRV